MDRGYFIVVRIGIKGIFILSEYYNIVSNF